MAARIDDLLVLGQNISKTDLAKYLRDREAVLPFDFGGLGDGAANDRTAIQACFDRAAADKKFAVIPPGTWRVDAGVVLGGGARGLIMQGVIQYTGATNAPATVLTLGDGGTTRNGEKLYLGLQVTRQIQSDWVSENDIGILARNLDSSLLDLRLVSGFTIGLRTLGDGRGFEDSTLILGRILNNRYGLDAHAFHTTSDFPLLLSAAANKMLLAAYQPAAPSYRQIFLRRDFRDFKPHRHLRVGDFPTLMPLMENGEIQAGTMSESQEIVLLQTFARRSVQTWVKSQQQLHPKPGQFSAAFNSKRFKRFPPP